MKMEILKLKYLPSLKNELLTLSIGGIGFQKKEIEINAENKIIDLGVIILVKSEAKLSEFIVMGKRRSFVGRILRKITKPFRKKVIYYNPK